MSHTKVLSYPLYPLLCSHSWDWVARGREEVQVHLRKSLCQGGHCSDLFFCWVLTDLSSQCLIQQWALDGLDEGVCPFLLLKDVSSPCHSVWGETQEDAVVSVEGVVWGVMYSEGWFGPPSALEGKVDTELEMWTFWTNLTTSSVGR